MRFNLIKTKTKELDPLNLTFSLSKMRFNLIERVNDRISIYKNKNSYYYILDAPDSFDEIKARVLKRKVVDYLVLSENNLTYSKESIKYLINLMVNRYYADNFTSYIVANDTIGYGPLSILMEDSKNIEEIVINGSNSPISLYHVKYGYCQTNLKFNDESFFRFIVNKLISKSDDELNEDNPIVDSQLDNGSRIHVQIKPYSQNGTIASIRLNGDKNMSVKKLIDLKSVSIGDLAYIWMAIDTKCNIIITGSPSSGKTTFLRALIDFLPRYSRVVIIEEDVNELNVHPNFTNSINLKGDSKGRIGIKDQVINSLHLRPDWLIVGEIRGEEAKDIFFGANSGIPFITTMHSELSSEMLLSRLRSRPMSIEDNLITALDIAIFMDQGEKRHVSGISEYKWIYKDNIIGEGIFSKLKINDIKSKSIFDDKSLMKSKVIERFSKLHMITKSESLKEFSNRCEFLKSIQSDLNVSDYLAGYKELVD